MTVTLTTVPAECQEALLEQCFRLPFRSEEHVVISSGHPRSLIKKAVRLDSKSPGTTVLLDTSSKQCLT